MGAAYGPRGVRERERDMTLERFVGLVAVSLSVAFTPTSVFAQGGTGTIAGVVQDQSGASIPGVSVRIVNDRIGDAIDVITNEEGVYRADGLAAGEYRIESALDGFETVIRNAAV